MIQNLFHNIRRSAFKYPPRMRITVGIFLVIGGVFGFLPILGFWMVPLGLIILSYDFPVVRRSRRRLEVLWLRWRRRVEVKSK